MTSGFIDNKCNCNKLTLSKDQYIYNPMFMTQQNVYSNI